VNTTAAAIEKNAPDTFRRINAGDAPYRDPENPELYAFVYDMNLTVVAHADNILLVGCKFQGKGRMLPVNHSAMIFLQER